MMQVYLQVAIRHTGDFPGRNFPGRQPIIVIGGYTGTGKTEILRMIGLSGEQVIDLEGLAHHKGSVFGALGQEDQPTNEQFENDIGQVWRSFDLSRPVWFEDESRMIGKVSLPEPVLNQINSGMLVRLEYIPGNPHSKACFRVCWF